MTASEAPAVEIRGLAKHYGPVRALDGVDLTVEHGSVFGFVGPNGAGKTTTLRVLLGLARADAGSVRVFGGEPGAMRRRIGFLPDVPGYYSWMRADEFLRFAGSLFSLDSDTLEARVRALLDMSGLGGVNTRIGGYSRGMRQRLGIAQALINAPDLLLLDEPTSALDPIGRKDVLDMIAELRGRTTVLFSTHILGDVERVCDHVAVLDHGRIRAVGPLDEVVSRHAGAQRVVVQLDGDAGDLAERLAGETWVETITRALPTASNGGDLVEIATDDIPRARRRLPVLVAELGAGLVRFEVRQPSLEDVFVSLVTAEPDPGRAERRPAESEGNGR